jgi:hypothetical protein
MGQDSPDAPWNRQRQGTPTATPPAPTRTSTEPQVAPQFTQIAPDTSTRDPFNQAQWSYLSQQVGQQQLAGGAPSNQTQIPGQPPPPDPGYHDEDDIQPPSTPVTPSTPNPNVPPGSVEVPELPGVFIPPPLLPKLQAMEQELADVLLQIGVARDEIPQRVALMTTRLAREQGLHTDQTKEALASRGLWNSDVREDDLRNLGLDYDRQRQDYLLGDEVAGALNRYAQTEAAARSRHSTGLADLSLEAAKWMFENGYGADPDEEGPGGSIDYKAGRDNFGKKELETLKRWLERNNYGEFGKAGTEGARFDDAITAAAMTDKFWDRFGGKGFGLKKAGLRKRKVNA